MKVKNMRPIEPELARCISVSSTNKLFAVGDKGTLLTHNSVSQQNIIFSCLLRPKDWVILGIDLKRVELSRYRKFGMKVATELPVAVDFLRFAQAVMMKRYERLEQAGENNFRDLAVPGQALMVMIDEAGELLSPTGAKALSEYTVVPTPEGKKLLRDIQEGDVVYDNYGEETTVTTKYEPVAQDHYSMKITKDSTGETENFISGAEHLWVVAYLDNEGNISEQETVDTKALHEFISIQKKLPEEMRRKVKIRKY